MHTFRVIQICRQIFSTGQVIRTDSEYQPENYQNEVENLRIVQVVGQKTESKRKPSDCDQNLPEKDKFKMELSTGYLPDIF